MGSRPSIYWLGEQGGRKVEVWLGVRKGGRKQERYSFSAEKEKGRKVGVERLSRKKKVRFDCKEEGLCLG